MKFANLRLVFGCFDYFLDAVKCLSATAISCLLVVLLLGFAVGFRLGTFALETHDYVHVTAQQATEQN